MSDPSLFDIDFKNEKPCGCKVILPKKNDDNSRPRNSTNAILVAKESSHRGGSNDTLLDHQFYHDQFTIGILGLPLNTKINSTMAQNSVDICMTHINELFIFHMCFPIGANSIQTYWYVALGHS